MINLVRFFFFQAEDGIRDYKVTGVQTCALPIFMLYHQLFTGGKRRTLLVRRVNTNDEGHYHFSALNPGTYFVAVLAQPWYARSEERRVGEEGRSRWAPDH